MESAMEVAESVYKGIKDRLISPLWGVFVLSWVAFNWRGMAFFFFSDLPVEDRLTQVTSTYSDFGVNLAYPFLTAYLITLLHPWVSFPSFWMQEYVDVKKRRQRFQLERQAPFSPEERELSEKSLREALAENGLLHTQLQELRRSIRNIDDSNDTPSSQAALMALREKLDGFAAQLDKVRTASEQNALPREAMDSLLFASQKAEFDRMLRTDSNFQEAMRLLTRHTGSRVHSIPEYELKRISRLGVTDESPSGILELTEKGKRYMEYMNEFHRLSSKPEQAG
jgi:hypothetical protein